MAICLRSAQFLKNEDIPVVLLASRNSKFGPHYDQRSGEIRLNPNFRVNQSIWGIWGFIRIIRAWGLIRSSKDFEIHNSGRTMTGAVVKLD